ncbi:MAG: S10 family serine carboxypeptidase-like protein, partial [Allosphingosinicella sp.]
MMKSTQFAGLLLGFAILAAPAAALGAQTHAGDVTLPPPPSSAPPQPAAASGPPLPAPAFVTRISDRPLTMADVPAPRRFVTRHETVIRGQRLRYTATAGETYISNLAGEPVARFFSFAYVREGSRDASRPVMFVFNGGPGSASIWLHMGVIGPRRLVLDQEVNPSSTPPFGLQDNPNSPLDVADLVFIDPVGTGFSQAAGNARNADFFGVDEDAESVARFIELWLTENGRWNSPKYLVGESYGSVRAAVLPRTLMGGPLYSGVMRGITVDGIVLLGVVLNNIGTPPAPAGPATAPDPRAGLFLPSFATTAWYHNRIDRAGRSVAEIYDEASRYGAGEYADAVHRLGAGTLSGSEKASVA